MAEQHDFEFIPVVFSHNGQIHPDTVSFLVKARRLGVHSTKSHRRDEVLIRNNDVNSEISSQFDRVWRSFRAEEKMPRRIFNTYFSTRWVKSTQSRR